MEVTGKHIEQSCPHKCDPIAMQRRQNVLLSLDRQQPHEETQAQPVEIDEEASIFQ